MLNLVKLYNEDNMDAKQMTNYQEINHITLTQSQRERERTADQSHPISFGCCG